MLIAWGSYRFQPGDCEVQITRENEYNAAQLPYGFMETWRLRINLFNRDGDVGSMDAKLAALDNAFLNNNGQDLKLLKSNGGSTQHELLSRNCLGGTMVKTLPSFPNGGGSQYVTTRDVEIVVQGLVLYSSPASSLRSWTETIQRSGGGSRRGCIETLTGDPVAQTYRQRTTFTATQSGAAVGILVRPTIPLPIWPEALTEAPVIVETSPDRIGNSYQNFGVTWQYQYESVSPLIGSPTPWI